jgi:hypothetical protein
LERMASMQIRRVQVGNYEVGEGTEGENEVWIINKKSGLSWINHNDYLGYSEI